MPDYNLYEQGEITVSECARLMGCSRTTVYKYIDIVEENAAGRRKAF